MKKAVLTAMLLSFAFGINAQAGEDHKHSKKEKQNHSEKAHKCEKCKKSDKDCKCDVFSLGITILHTVYPFHRSFLS